MAGWRGQTALITGASGGIGLKLARCCARSGFDLVLVAAPSPAWRVAGELNTETGVRCTPSPPIWPVEAPAWRSACGGPDRGGGADHQRRYCALRPFASCRSNWAWCR